MSYQISQDDIGNFIIGIGDAKKSLGNCSIDELEDLKKQGIYEYNHADKRLGKIKYFLALAELTWRNAATNWWMISVHDGSYYLKLTSYSIFSSTGYMTDDRLKRVFCKGTQYVNSGKTDLGHFIQYLCVSEYVWRQIKAEAQKKADEEAVEILRLENERKQQIEFEIKQKAEIRAEKKRAFEEHLNLKHDFPDFIITSEGIKWNDEDIIIFK